MNTGEVIEARAIEYLICIRRVVSGPLQTFEVHKFLQLRYAYRNLLVCLLLIVGISTLHAQEQADVHPYLTDKFFIDVGVFFADRDTRVRVDGVISGENEDFNSESATGVNKMIKPSLRILVGDSEKSGPCSCNTSVPRVPREQR